MYQVLAIAPPLLFAIILHEIAHAYVAERLGDPTARKLGRITLNPLKHIDPLMTIIVPGVLIASGSPFIFGGAKPVPVNPYNFSKPRRHMAYVAMAGPAINFILAILCGGLIQMFWIFETLLPNQTNILVLIGFWLSYGFIINVLLALFNLLPVPPLDGGRIAVGFLPLSIAEKWQKLEPFGLIIVVALLFSGLIETVLAPALEFAAKLF